MSDLVYKQSEVCGDVIEVYETHEGEEYYIGCLTKFDSEYELELDIWQRAVVVEQIVGKMKELNQNIEVLE